MKKRQNYIFTLLISSLLLLFSVTSWAELPPVVDGKPVPSLAPMLKQVLPAIVNVSVVGSIPVTPNPFAEPGRSGSHKANPNSPRRNDNGNQQGDENGNAPAYPGQARKFGALGSGVIINAEKGYIVTNAHVIKDADTITVTLKDGRQFKAKVIGSDPASDVAVLQIDAKNLHQLSLANSTNLHVGDFVVAIGSPFGLNQTVTSGIVSGLQRTNLGIEGYENFIQTDAPINPGNSGGALVDLQGKLIGINTAILAPDGGNIGIGFAIPANMVKSIVAQLIKYGAVHRGLMGIMVQSLTPPLAEAFNTPNQEGAIVTMVTPYSPAAKAGFKTGDVIVKVDGNPITSAAQVTNFVGLTRVGSKINVEVLRNDKPLNLQVTTASPKAYRKLTEQENPFLFGVNLQNYSQLTALHGALQGVQVTGMSEESPAARAMPIGLRPGDVIVSANGAAVKNINDLKRIADAANKDHKELLLNVLRGTGGMFVVIK